MSLDTLLDSLQRAHGGSTPGSGLPHGDPAWLDGGLILLREAARDLDYWARFGAGKCTPAQLRAILLRAIERGKAAVGVVARRFTSGALDLAGWARTTLARLVPTYQAGTMALAGSTGLEAPARSALAGLIAKQAKWLGRFRSEIGAGTTPTAHDGLPAPGFLNRIRLYADAAYQIAYDVERRQRIRAGYKQERRILSASKNCRTCLDEATKGFRPIGTLKKIGDSECRVNCRCYFIFSF